MKKLSRWLRWSAVLLVCVFCGLWCAGEVSQWVLRLRAEQMLADFRSIQVGQKSSAEAEAFSRKWRQKADIGKRCDKDACTQWVAMGNWLPGFLIGNSLDDRPQWSPAILDCVGIRPASVYADITESKDTVTGTRFIENIGTPMHNFRGQNVLLSVVSEENSVSTEGFARHMNPDHPFRWARWGAPAYSLFVEFKPEESEAERRTLMDFRFACITRIIPCRKLEEILPETHGLRSEIQIY